MTGENALKACARELLAAEMGVPVKSEYDRDLSDYDQCFIDQAVAAIEKALTRSPVCEDAGEVVEALDEARALRDFVFDRTPGGQACGHEDLRLRRLAAGHVNRMDTLAKALPSLPGGGK